MQNRWGSWEWHCTDWQHESLFWVINATAQVLRPWPSSRNALLLFNMAFHFCKCCTLWPSHHLAVSLWQPQRDVWGSAHSLWLYIRNSWMDSIYYSSLFFFLKYQDLWGISKYIYCIMYSPWEIVDLKWNTFHWMKACQQLVGTWLDCWSCLGHGQRPSRLRCPLWSPLKQTSWWAEQRRQVAHSHLPPSPWLTLCR